ncbi:hypothetical protein GCN74_09720 [Janthinobacterium sp. FT14W]|uniref:hypothetical protein n=1 Tax=Janthinobacterium sp. FT14W TaxID=2654253 RepID=UPI0012644B60|nr:hypothetical protein [Janthinobacterium sp. FT14W]KAB8060227.1 hypothetical protein GCN74_09720 [Janthinobacterium sp. FT14W]
MPGRIQPMRRQLLRLAGALLCPPVLARAAGGGLTRAVRQRIVATLDAPLPKILNVHHLALIHGVSTSAGRPWKAARPCSILPTRWARATPCNWPCRPSLARMRRWPRSA